MELLILLPSLLGIISSKLKHVRSTINNTIPTIKRIIEIIVIHNCANFNNEDIFNLKKKFKKKKINLKEIKKEN